MTSLEIQKIEETLGVQLPPLYIEWLLTLPPVGLETKDWHWYFNDPEVVIEVNQRVRASGCHQTLWQPTHFCIGESDGNYTFLDLEDPESSIYHADHDGGPCYDELTWRECFYKNGREFFPEM